MTKTPEDPTHVLELLAQEVGSPKKLSIESIVAGTSDADLVAVGNQIDSRRIVTDAARIYQQAWAFWSQATKPVQKNLRGFSRDLLALAVAQALELESLRRTIAAKASKGSTVRAALSSEALSASVDGLALRDQAFAALRDAGQTQAYRDQVGAAVGTAATPSALARGLEGLSTVLTGWLASKDVALHHRLAGANLDADYASELEAAAVLILTTAAAASQIATERVTQGALDRADGVNMLLLGQIVRAFAGAHQRNPTVPRLVPIATRRLFSRKTKKGVAAAPLAVSESAAQSSA
jgi:hypothetical protein